MKLLRQESRACTRGQASFGMRANFIVPCPRPNPANYYATTLFPKKRFYSLGNSRKSTLANS